MKKINKKSIVVLIILIIMLIIQIKAFRDSRANKLTYVTANVIDSSGLLGEEIATILATSETENGMSIILPDYLNTKKVNKYIITKKEIIETDTTDETELEEETEIETDMIEESTEVLETTETTETEQTEETIPKTEVQI